MSLGSRENPCRNNYDIDKIIRGMKDCSIYTLNTFTISDENMEQAKARNIQFIGEMVAYFEIPTLPIYSDKIVDQIQKAVEESISRVEENLKNKYMGGFY